MIERDANEVIAAGEAYAQLLENFDRARMTQGLRDRIDAIARRVNAAQDKNVYGFEIAE